MSTLLIRLAVCFELRARLRLVRESGNPAESSESRVSMFFVGVDVAKYRHEVCITDDSGNVLLQIHMDNRHSGLNKLVSNLERLGVGPDNSQFCMEATSWVIKHM